MRLLAPTGALLSTWWCATIYIQHPLFEFSSIHAFLYSCFHHHQKLVPRWLYYHKKFLQRCLHHHHSKSLEQYQCNLCHKNVKCWISNVQCPMLNAECRMSYVKCQMSNINNVKLLSEFRSSSCNFLYIQWTHTAFSMTGFFLRAGFTFKFITVMTCSSNCHLLVDTLFHHPVCTWWNVDIVIYCLYINNISALQCHWFLQHFNHQYYHGIPPSLTIKGLSSMEIVHVQYRSQYRIWFQMYKLFSDFWSRGL